MTNLSRLEADALFAVQNAHRMLELADTLCAEAGMDGDEVVQPIAEARRLLEQVAKIIQG